MSHSRTSLSCKQFFHQQCIAIYTAVGSPMVLMLWLEVGMVMVIKQCKIRVDDSLDQIDRACGPTAALSCPESAMLYSHIRQGTAVVDNSRQLNDKMHALTY
jgi:hypothetical protein